MNKILSFVVVLFTAMSVYAAHDQEEYRVKVIKSDGTAIYGYSKTDFLNTNFPKVTKFTFSTEYDGEKTTFTSDEVERVEFVNLAIDDIPLVFESVKAQSRVPVTSGQNPKLYKTRVFLRLFYDGENVGLSYNRDFFVVYFRFYYRVRREQYDVALFNEHFTVDTASRRQDFCGNVFFRRRGEKKSALCRFRFFFGLD